jgi:antitoxin MazE
MQTRVQKWGDGLALCIPKALASQTGLTEDMLVDVELVEGKVVIRPARRTKLEELLRGVTPENIHAEVDTGPPVGGEVW